MVEKLIVLLGTFALLGYDGIQRKQKLGKAKLPYAIILGCTLYLGVDYLLPAKLPHVNELLNLMFERLAHAIETAWQQPAA